MVAMVVVVLKEAGDGTIGGTTTAQVPFPSQTLSLSISVIL